MTSILLISLRFDTFGKKGISFLRNRIFCAITLLRRESCRIVDRLGREGSNFCETTKAFRVISGIFTSLITFRGGLFILPKYLGHTMTMYVYLVQTVESMLEFIPLHTVFPVSLLLIFSAFYTVQVFSPSIARNVTCTSRVSEKFTETRS